MIKELKESVKRNMQAKHCELNGIKFDSLGERDFYVKASFAFGAGNVFRAPTISLHTSCCNDIPSIKWTPDFVVTYGEINFYLEYKGSARKSVFGNEVFMLKWALAQATRNYTSNKFLCFVEDGWGPRWKTEKGFCPVPHIYSNKSLDSGALLALVHSIAYPST